MIQNQKYIRACTLLLILTLLLPSQFSWAMARSPKRNQSAAQGAGQDALRLTLTDCYRLALKQSEKIAMSYEDIELTEAEFFKAASVALGDIDYEISNTRQEYQGSGASDTSAVAQTSSSASRRERKITFSQPVFLGFRAIAALGAAGSLHSQRTEEWIRAKQLLFMDVSDAFYGVLKDQKDIEVLNQTNNLLRERIETLTEREKIGRSRPSELATAKASLKRLEAGLAKARGELAISQHLLSYLIGTPVAAAQLTDTDLSKDMRPALEAYVEFVDSRPDVEAARQSMKTAFRGIINAQSYFWPEINVEGNLYQKREGFQSGIDWDMLLKMTIPLFRGGENIGKIKESISVWKKYKYAYQLARRDAELDIKQSFEYWVSSLEVSKASEDAAVASQESYDMQKDEYSRNLVNNLDVLAALETLHTVKREANTAFYDMKQNFWQLQIATGQCCESI